MTATARSHGVADRLKEARERRGLSQRQIADVTKLSPQVIRALEDDRVNLLPSGIYRRALVRAIAREVGLDPEQELQAFLVEHPDDFPMAGQPVQPPPPPATRGPWRKAFAFLGAIVPLLAGVAYFGGAVRSFEEPRPGRAMFRDTQSAEAGVLPVGGFSDVAETIVRPVQMLITISSRCQLRIAADGREVLGRTVEAGERLLVNIGEAVELFGDNAGAVQFSINGLGGRLLGDAGAPLAVRIGRDDYDSFLASH